MKLLSFVVLAAIVTCASARQGDLPKDVQKYIDVRDGCDHFRGEPWDLGDEPEVKQRRDFIFARTKELCVGTDRRLAQLRAKYRNNKDVSERLRIYEDNIEPK